MLPEREYETLLRRSNTKAEHVAKQNKEYNANGSKDMDNVAAAFNSAKNYATSDDARVKILSSTLRQLVDKQQATRGVVANPSPAEARRASGEPAAAAGLSEALILSSVSSTGQKQAAALLHYLSAGPAGITWDRSGEVTLPVGDGGGGGGSTLVGSHVAALLDYATRRTRLKNAPAPARWFDFLSYMSRANVPPHLLNAKTRQEMSSGAAAATSSTTTTTTEPASAQQDARRDEDEEEEEDTDEDENEKYHSAIEGDDMYQLLTPVKTMPRRLATPAAPARKRRLSWTAKFNKKRAGKLLTFTSRYADKPL